MIIKIIISTTSSDYLTCIPIPAKQIYIIKLPLRQTHKEKKKVGGWKRRSAWSSILQAASSGASQCSKGGSVAILSAATRLSDFQ